MQERKVNHSSKTDKESDKAELGLAFFDALVILRYTKREIKSRTLQR